MGTFIHKRLQNLFNQCSQNIHTDAFLDKIFIYNMLINNFENMEWTSITLTENLIVLSDKR